MLEEEYKRGVRWLPPALPPALPHSLTYSPNFFLYFLKLLIYNKPFRRPLTLFFFQLIHNQSTNQVIDDILPSLRFPRMSADYLADVVSNYLPSTLSLSIDLSIHTNSFSIYKLVITFLTLSIYPPIYFIYLYIFFLYVSVEKNNKNRWRTPPLTHPTRICIYISCIYVYIYHSHTLSIHSLTHSSINQ